jgi:hypothetical protein
VHPLRTRDDDARKLVVALAALVHVRLFSDGRPTTRGGLLHAEEVVRLERTQEVPAIQDHDESPPNLDYFLRSPEEKACIHAKSSEVRAGDEGSDR